MDRRYLGYNNNPLKAKHSGVIHNINKQTVNSSRVILLDSSLKLQVTPSIWIHQNPKIDFLEASKRQDNRTVLELNDYVSLIKINKKPKVNFVDFIDTSKIKTENNLDTVNINQEFDEIKHTEESSTESNNNKNNSLVLVQDKILKTKDNKIINISKPVLNLTPGTIKKVSFPILKKKITLDKTILKEEQESHKNQMKKQTVQIETQPLKLTESLSAHSTSSSDCRNITKVQNEHQLLNKKIYLQRVIKLRPLNLNAFKSSQKKKEQQLSSILKKVIKNNISEELPQSCSKEAFPVALKSIDHGDIELLDLHPMNQCSEQILGI